uniref:Phosphodiesterase n=1 Tax=Strombidium rassoulzadegani TaxID=1082188 RepID=A0A7S3FVS4_9SPIT|mmetsp:Transcript_16625/g.28333  ORF Transcript_16625/g.28333 Transcript_16625/m.28333 type:complete len:748 (+) Transcript_16625:127-2370(+)|eukprot:CAMPEP_0168616150 /NCGR_PEP_ID=MMETSP0449_2-20121227/4881_1 /TAXON_ID=1082188 /ORGANISM="Strombidium rassoulzadegani, Strain ras09" /LENGTH=747 /DNA_ID=CAMNT_0008656931 /DNA_START=44 /DNA_END=2287 /DNA_ORIENTATION=+
MSPASNAKKANFFKPEVLTPQQQWRRQVDALLFEEWRHRVEEDGMFDEDDFDKGDSGMKPMHKSNKSEMARGGQSSKSVTSQNIQSKSLPTSEQKGNEPLLTAHVWQKWTVTQENMREFIEAIEVHPFIELEEFSDIVEGMPNQQISFEMAVKTLIKMLVDDRKIPFNQLILKHHSIPADRIIKFMKMLRKDLLSRKEQGNMTEVDQFYLQETQYALQKINKREMFTSTNEVVKLMHMHRMENSQTSKRQSLMAIKKNTKKKNRLSMRLQWMNEFSDIGSEVQSNNTINMVKIGSAHLEIKDNQSVGDDYEEVSSNLGLKHSTSQSMFKKQGAVNANFIQRFRDHEAEFADFEKLEFRLFEVSDKVGRQYLLPFSVVDALQKLELNELINEDHIVKFLIVIQKTYRTDIQYHNDLHGADVMQMAFYMLTTCQLQKKLRINKLDTLSLIISAACHDLGHDGFTNSYHVNAITRRAIDSNDVSVQESFHVSELFRILQDDSCNFLNCMSKEEFKIFRKRTVGLILATDMARHVADLSSLNAMIGDNSIKDGENISSLFEGIEQAEIFKNQQFMMEICLHACDISQQTRGFDYAKKWTYLLFEEFFDQGDIEKNEKLPVSMLCDRVNTNVMKSQPGFISFVTLPLFSAASNFLPQLQTAVDNLKNNSKVWQKMEESEEDLKVYVPRPVKKHIKVKIDREFSILEEEEKLENSELKPRERRTGIQVNARSQSNEHESSFNLNMANNEEQQA